MEIVQGFRSRGKDHDVDRKGFISTYVLSNMPAFETVQPNSSKYWGENTFRIFYLLELFKQLLGFAPFLQEYTST